MKKVFKISLIIIVLLISIIGLGYVFLIYEKPVDQEALRIFLQGQPVIDTVIHATKGYEGSEDYKIGFSEGLIRLSPKTQLFHIVNPCLMLKSAFCQV